MHTSHLVSIITVTYNAEKYLEQTIRSVIAQTYPNIEYIIIDGGSTDGTIDIIKKYSDRIAHWVSEPDKGIYDAMNKGIRFAHGELIGIVNASDYYAKDTIQKVVEAYQTHPNAGILHGNINMLNEDGSLFKHKVADTNLQHLEKGFFIFHPTFFVAKRVYDTMGLYDTTFRLAADYDFALRCWKAGTEFYHIDSVLSNFRVGGATNQQRQKSLAESKRALINNGVSEQAAEKTYLIWKSKMRKDILARFVYDKLRKILPFAFVQKTSEFIKIR